MPGAQPPANRPAGPCPCCGGRAFGRSISARPLYRNGGARCEAGSSGHRAVPQRNSSIAGLIGKNRQGFGRLDELGQLGKRTAIRAGAPRTQRSLSRMGLEMATNLDEQAVCAADIIAS